MPNARKRNTAAAKVTLDVRHTETLLKTGALQSAIFNSANFSSIATDAKGVIQIFNVGAERMLGYTAADAMNKITPADISDPQEVIARHGLRSGTRRSRAGTVRPEGNPSGRATVSGDGCLTILTK